MVARLLRLRIALALAPLRRGAGPSLIAAGLRAVYLVAAGVLAYAPVFLVGTHDLDRLARLDVVFGSILMGCVLVLPLCIPKLHLDERLFAQYPTTPTKLTLGLLVTAPVTWTGAAALVWCVTFVASRADLIEWNAVTVIALAVVVVTLGVLGRAGGLLGAVLAQRLRAQNLRQGIGALVLMAVFPIFALIGVSVLRADGADQLRETSAIFSWTPFGAAFATLYRGVTTIDVSPFQLGGQIAIVSLLVGAMISLTTVLLQRIDYPAPGMMRENALGWFGYLPHTPAMAVGARSLTYWMKDPRYLVALAAIPVIPVLVVGVLLFAGVEAAHVAVLPLIIVLIMLGWMVHNDVATDSTAVWIHVASGITGLQDRVGRLVPVLVFGVPVLVLGTSITVLVMGNWQAFPAVFAAGSVAMCVSSGMSSVMSALRPYPTTRPRESPFVQPAWHGSGAGVAQTVSLIGSAVLVAPPAWVLLTQPDIGLGGSVTLSAISLVYGVVILVLGIVTGSAIYRRRSSELLAFTQMFD